MKTFIVVQNIPSPYRIHLFSVLSRSLQRRGYAFHVHFMAEGHQERPVYWKRPTMPFGYTYWKTDWGWGTHHFNPGLILHLLTGGPVDCLLVGSAFDTFTGILASILVKREKGILWTEGNSRTPGKMIGFIGWFKRYIFGRYDCISVPGIEGERYIALHQQHTKKNLPKTITLPNIVDESRFTFSGNSDRYVSKKKMMPDLSLGEHLALCPARLEPVKGLLEFIDKLQIDLLRTWKLVIVGEGSLKNQIFAKIRSKGLEGRVILLDYVPYEDMPNLYRSADLFVLPSLYDPNPLSVVEAMHSGLPLLLSRQVGNYPEALLQGVTGWGFSPFDTAEVGSAITDAFSASNEELRRLGRNAKEKAQEFWNSEDAINRFLDEIGLSGKQ